MHFRVVFQPARPSENLRFKRPPEALCPWSVPECCSGHLLPESLAPSRGSTWHLHGRTIFRHWLNVNLLETIDFDGFC